MKMQNGRRALVLCLILLLLTTMLPATTAQQIAAGIVIASVSMGEGTGRRALVQFQPATGDVTYLTNGDYLDGGGELSPDGTKYVFMSNRAGGRDLFILDMATGTIIPLLIAPSNERNPRWSPDGAQIAYESRGRDGSPFSNIYLIHVDGTHDQALTTTGGRNHVWSPDGNSIAFNNRDLNWYRIDLDGTNLQQITFGTYRGTYAQWSPDGTRFAFLHADRLWHIDLNNPVNVQAVESIK
jgi:Tol biopolymer transport system component